jgi:hypothetical protein
MWAREDEGVKEVAGRLDLSYAGGERRRDGTSESVGKLRANVRTAVQALTLGFVPSEHINL